jgi:gamma-glutamylcyclotransferase (GGCT)/AIG2-like uncharacterized protein YtfP
MLIGEHKFSATLPCRVPHIWPRTVGSNHFRPLSNPMPLLLFLYGTLHPDRAPAEIAVASRRLTPIARGTIRARLLDLGDYPGIILEDPTTDGPVALIEAPTVPGEVFSVPDAATLAELDRYEDFRPTDPAASLFLRKKAIVTFDDGSQQSCWVYVYNRA